MSGPHFDLRARLATGEPFLFSWLTIPSAILAGQAARLPFDGVCLDLQHGLIGHSDMVAMLAAINALGKPAMVRALWNDPATAGLMFDSGASLVISPMINTREQAEALVRSAKYPPMGARSWGGYTAQQTMGLPPSQYLREANHLSLVFAMVETAEALGNVEAIAATPGLDGLFVGPSDLSISLSQGAEVNKLSPRVLDAMQRVSSAAKANGLFAGAFGGSAEVIKTYRQLGFTFFAAAVEVDLMQWGAAALRKTLEA